MYCVKVRTQLIHSDGTIGQGLGLILLVKASTEDEAKRIVSDRLAGRRHFEFDKVAPVEFDEVPLTQIGTYAL